MLHNSGIYVRCLVNVAHFEDDSLHETSTASGPNPWQHRIQCLWWLPSSTGHSISSKLISSPCRYPSVNKMFPLTKIDQHECLRYLVWVVNSNHASSPNHLRWNVPSRRLITKRRDQYSVLAIDHWDSTVSRMTNTPLQYSLHPAPPILPLFHNTAYLLYSNTDHSNEGDKRYAIQWNYRYPNRDDQIPPKEAQDPWTYGCNAECVQAGL